MKNFNDLNNIIINLNLAILLAFLGFIFSIEEKDQIETILSIATLVIVTISLGANLWSRYRLKIRNEIFVNKMKSFADTSLRLSLEIVDKVARQNVNDEVKVFFKENADLIKNKTKEEISFYLKLYWDSKVKGNAERPYVDLLVFALGKRVEDIRIECFRKALSENFSTIKLYTDRIAFTSRVYLFSVSILLFLITVILLILQ